MKSKWLIVAGLLALGCNENTVSAPTKQQCPEDAQDVELPSGELACKIERPIVIETGFECRSPLWTNRFDFQTFSICDRRVNLPRIDLDFLNGLDLHALKPARFPAIPTAPIQSNALDLLWVIDNSGSMCEEQAQVIEGVRDFVKEIVDAGIDLQMGITTTQTNPDYTLEPLAKPGVLQAQPQPVPGFDPTCINGLDANHQPIPGDYTPIQKSLEISRSCVADLQPGEFEWTTQDIDCAYRQTPGCEIAALGCTGDQCTLEMLFPAPQRYRALPKVFKSSTYLVQGFFEFDQMAADLACMAIVGTRGYGIEKGFEAAELALSPSLAGPNGPNAGLIRQDSRVGILFVTDEDDCTGDVDAQGPCGEKACAFAQSDAAWGTLTPVEEVAANLQSQVGALKGRELDPRELLVASFHAAGGYDGPVPATTVSNQACTSDPRYEIFPACATSLGTAYGGRRYGEFLRALPLGNAYPFSPNRVTPIDGVVCEGGLFNPLKEVGAFFVDATASR